MIRFFTFQSKEHLTTDLLKIVRDIAPATRGTSFSPRIGGIRDENQNARKKAIRKLAEVIFKSGW